MILPILLNKTKLLPIYVLGMGTKEHQDHIIRRCGFSGYQFLYCTDGRGRFSVEGKTYDIGKGDAFFFRPDVPHEYYATEGRWRTRWVVFTGDAVENILEYLGFGAYEVFSIRKFEEFDIQVNNLSDMFWCDDPDKEIKTSMLMYRLIIKMGESRNNIPDENNLSRNQKYEKLSPAIELLKSRYQEDLSLEDIADSINISPNHLCRLFNQVYGITPLKYLTHLRLNMAKYYLCSPGNMKVKEIADAVGFKSPGYFCSVFKKAEGMMPDDFRRINAF